MSFFHLGTNTSLIFILSWVHDTLLNSLRKLVNLHFSLPVFLSSCIYMYNVFSCVKYKYIYKQSSVHRMLIINYLNVSTDYIAKVDWLFYNLTTDEVHVQLSLIVSIFCIDTKVLYTFNFSDIFAVKSTSRTGSF